MFRPRPKAQQASTSSPEQFGQQDGAGTLASSSPDPGPSTSTSLNHDSAAGSSSETGFIAQMLEDNPYFSAGAGLMGIGVALTALRRGTKLGATFAQRRMLVSLEIPSKDRSYPWFLEWMASQAPQPTGQAISASEAAAFMGKGKGKLSLRSHELAVETTYKQHEGGASEAVFNLVPGPGTHYFKYRGSWFQVKRERDAKLMDLHSGSPWETLTLTTLSSSRNLFPVLLSEARALAEQSTEGKTVIYTAWGVEWRPFGKPRRRREMGSVVLAEGVAERVEDDVRRFLGRAKWYAERGIPYRRGYLLHGPPGSGKTSFIQALAGAVGYNICLLNLSERGLTDDKLNHLLGLAPERSFILLEDIDSAFNRRAQTSEDGFKGAVTFSGLLNALDGVASTEERIIFMTTNHYDRLDPALIRPGRVDLAETLDDAAGEQAERLFVKFYGSTTDEQRVKEGVEYPIQTEVKSLGREVGAIVDRKRKQGRPVSMASLQGLFIRNGAREAANRVENLCQTRT